MAIGDVRENLLAWLTSNGGIHAETLLCVTGALTEYASQTAIWETYVKQNRPTLPNGFMSAQTHSGKTFYFGDLLNAFLFPQKDNDLPLWMFAAGAAVNCGVNENNLSNPGILFQRAASTIGAPAIHYSVQECFRSGIGWHIVMQSAIMASKYDGKALKFRAAH